MTGGGSLEGIESSKNKQNNEANQAYIKLKSFQCKKKVDFANYNCSLFVQKN